jgi:Ras-related protein Rab-6A
MIGTSATGKTSLIYRFINDAFDNTYLNTVGIDLKAVTLQINETNVRVNIWDTTGQEKFSSLTKRYYRNCNGAVAVFDITKRDSFYSLEASIRKFRNNCPPEAVDNIVLVGNKVDLVDQRKISLEEGNNFVTRLNLMSYLETSAQ